MNTGSEPTEIPQASTSGVVARAQIWCGAGRSGWGRCRCAGCRRRGPPTGPACSRPGLVPGSTLDRRQERMGLLTHELAGLRRRAGRGRSRNYKIADSDEIVVDRHAHPRPQWTGGCTSRRQFRDATQIPRMPAFTARLLLTATAGDDHGHRAGCRQGCNPRSVVEAFGAAIRHLQRQRDLKAGPQVLAMTDVRNIGRSRQATTQSVGEAPARP
jgi:hypothetical protein